MKLDHKNTKLLSNSSRNSRSFAGGSIWSCTAAVEVAVAVVLVVVVSSRSSNGSS